MYPIEDATFEATKSSGSSFSFRRLGTACPHCGRSAWFEFETDVNRADIANPPRVVNCPGCHKPVTYYIISRPNPHQIGWLWAHPSPRTQHLHRGDVATALGRMHPALREAYDEATATLASGHASSATIQARRTLEGLVKHLLEDGGQSVAPRGALEQLIRTLTNHVDLAKPLTDTAHAVRQGGNLGAHYDTEIIASKELATKTIELVEAIADYLLVLPEKVEELRRLLEKDPGETSEPESAAADV